MKKLTALLLCLCMIFAVSGCGEQEPKGAGKPLTYQLEGEPQTLDPQIADGTSSSIVIEALYEGLVRLDADGKPYPGTALEWTANAEFTEFTFQLRSDARWGNKEALPVTAGDFVFAFRRALTPETGSSTCEPLYCIKNARDIRAGKLAPEELGVRAVDQHTLVVELEYSYENFPALTASVPFMPCNQSYFESTAGRYGLSRDTILGNGPFVIDGPYGWEQGAHINLKRSANYKGEKYVYPASLICLFKGGKEGIFDPVSAFSEGTLDASAIPAAAVDKAKEAQCGITAFEDTTWGLCFNVRRGDSLNPLQNLSIRKALLQSFDRQALLAYTPEGMRAAEDIVTPGTLLFGTNYRAAAGTGFYLKQGGNPRALMSTGMQACGLTEVPKINLLCPDNPDAQKMAASLISSWNTSFNAYFNMEPLSEEKLTSRVLSGGFDIAIYPLRPSADGPQELLSQFVSGAENNPAGLASADYDALLSTAGGAGSAEATAAYAAAEKYLSEQALFYPLYYESHYYACAPGISGIVFHPYGAGVDFIQAAKVKPTD